MIPVLFLYSCFYINAFFFTLNCVQQYGLLPPDGLSMYCMCKK